MSETKERILVSTFVERYNKLANEQLKRKYAEEHVKLHYSPVLNKINILKLMTEKSVVNGVHGKYIDLAISKINLIAAILVLYTDLTVDKNEEDNPLTFESYDLLKSSGALESILQAIGTDIEELMHVQSSIMDNWYAENSSTQAYISDLIQQASHKFGVAAGVGMQKLSEVLDDEKKMEKVATVINKVVKKVK